MITIKVNVNGCDFAFTEPKIASGSAGVIKLMFAFSNEWKALAKTAVFHMPYGDILIPLSEDSCFIPAEAVAKSGKLTFGVFGTDGEGTITTVFHSVDVLQGVPTSGISAKNYTPSLYEQFAAKFAKFENMAVFAEDGDTAAATLSESDGRMLLNLVLPKGDKGERGEKGDKGDAFTYEDLTYEEKCDFIENFVAVEEKPYLMGMVRFDTEEEFEEWQNVGLWSLEMYFTCNHIVFIGDVPKYIWFAEETVYKEFATNSAALGDIETALDGILAIQNSLIGGGGE